MANKLYQVDVYGSFEKYDVSSIIVVAPDETKAVSIARSEEPAWRNKIVVAEPICMCVPMVLAKSYADRACEIYPEDCCGF